MKNLIIRTLTGIVYVGLVVASFFLPVFYFHFLFLFFTWVATFEFLRLSNNNYIKPQKINTYIIVTLTFIILQGYYLMGDNSIFIFPSLFFFMLIWLMIFIIICVKELYRNQKNPLINIANSLMAVVWIGIPFGLLGLWMLYFNALNVGLALFLIIWLNDTLAYCAGSLFGKHKLAEKISPNKTWEGFIIAILLTVFLSILITRIPYFENSVITRTWEWMVFALIVGIFGTFGDLVESMFKRSAHIKDSGKIFPGHGGVLDRLDSFLFALPAGFLFWMILKIIAVR